MRSLRAIPIHSFVESATCRARCYRPLRNAFHRVYRPTVYAERQRQRAFFAQLIAPGALVFDVGATHGRLSEVFVEVGARVIAIEPNPALVSAIQRRYGDKVVVEPVAISDRCGRSTLRLGVWHEHSSISDKWVSLDPLRWAGSVSVSTVTLDELIKRHGIPQFIKLDIEGSELEALRALSVAVQLLSFEYHTIALDRAVACVRRTVELGFTRFNMTPAETPEFVGRWLSSDELIDSLSNQQSNGRWDYGDIYAATHETSRR